MKDLPYPMPLSMRDTVNIKLGDRQTSGLDSNGRFIVRALVAEAYAEGHRDGRVDEMQAQSVERDLTPKPPEDERIGAWGRVASHPFFKSCYPEEAPLIDSMIAKLDGLLVEESMGARPTEDQ